MHVGTVLAERYEVRELLARGGMADVHRAFDRTLERDVAVKVLRSPSADAGRFEAELRVLATVQHPNLVRLLDAGEHDGLPFLVLQLVEGPTLAERIDHRGALPAAEVAAVGRDVAGALAHVHAAGVVHRDVKPSNILIAADGRALLGDFGVARLLDATSATQTGMLVGTARYLAPEQAAGEPVTPAADVYGLGLVLLEALTGTAAFDGTPAEMAFARVHRSPEIPGGLAPPWTELLPAMTARHPDDRPDAAAVAAVLAHDPDATRQLSDRTRVLPLAAAGRARATGSGRPGGVAPSVAGLDRRWLWPVAALVVLFVGLLVAAALLRGDDAGQDGTTTPSTGEPATTTASPTSEPPRTTAPPTTAGGQAACAQLEQQKRALEAEKQRIEQQHKDDKELREQLKEDLEEQKDALDDRKEEAGC